MNEIDKRKIRKIHEAPIPPVSCTREQIKRALANHFKKREKRKIEAETMGSPERFMIQFTSFIGFGLSWQRYKEAEGTLFILSLPFFYISFFTGIIDEEEQCEHGKGLNDYCSPCGRIHSCEEA